MEDRPSPSLAKDDLPKGPKTERNLTEGPILGNLWQLAWPIMITNLLQTAYNLTDTYWVGRLGADAMASITISWPVVFLLISVAGGFTVAGTTLVAQHKGAGAEDKTDLVAGQALSFIGAIAVLLAGIGYLVAPLVLSLMGAPSAILDDGTAYLRVFFVGIPFMFGFFIFSSLLRGWGDTVTPMYLMLASTTLNVILDPLFIFGWGPFPRMGVMGAALATVLARGLIAMVALYILFYGDKGIQLHISDLKFRWEYVRQIVVVGFPASIEQSARALGIAFMTSTVAVFGTGVIAAYGVGNRIMSTLFLPAAGFAQATTTMVGQNLGGGKPDRAEKATWTSVGLLMGILTAAALASFIWAEDIVSIFNRNPDVVDLGCRYLRIAAFSYGFAGALRTFNGAYRGAGRTVTAMVFSIVTLWVLRVPLANLFARYLGWGADGLWWAVSIDNVVGGLAAGAWFTRGTWKTVVVDTAEEPTAPEE